VDDILGLVRSLAPHFQQTVLLGYPPFLKGVVDAGAALAAAPRSVPPHARPALPPTAGVQALQHPQASPHAPPEHQQLFWH
jgi:hypothetical protein